MPQQGAAVTLLSVEGVANHIEAKLLFKIQIQNSSAQDIHFSEASWESYINTESFNNGDYKEECRIKRKQAVVIEVPIVINYAELFETIPAVKGTARADYRIPLEVRLRGKTEKTEKTEKIEATGYFPVLQAPKFGRQVIRVEKVHPGTVEWYVSINVENPNPFELPEHKRNFTFFVEERAFIKRTIPHRHTLAQSTTTPIVFGLLVDYADVYRVFPHYITAPEIPSHLEIAFDFEIPAFKDDKFELKMETALPRSP